MRFLLENGLIPNRFLVFHIPLPMSLLDWLVTWPSPCNHSPCRIWGSFWGWPLDPLDAKIMQLWWKNHHDATMFNWTMFNCWFETSSDKLQNVTIFADYRSLWSISHMPIKCAYLSEKSIHKSHRCISRTGQQTCIGLSYRINDGTMSHIVESCPLTKLNGGLSRLHSADEDAVSWLTSYG